MFALLLWSDVLVVQLRLLTKYRHHGHLERDDHPLAVEVVGRPLVLHFLQYQDVLDNIILLPFPPQAQAAPGEG